jgi:hypothetical protein
VEVKSEVEEPPVPVPVPVPVVKKEPRISHKYVNKHLLKKNITGLPLFSKQVLH